MNDKDFTVGIVGAGLGGLALALALRRHGIHARVYEQAERFDRVGAGINITPNAALALAGLGVVDDLERFACHPQRWQSLQWDTAEVISQLPLGRSAHERYGAPFLQTHRGDLHRVLAEHVPPDTVHLRSRVEGLTSRTNGIDLELADGRRDRVDAVVGADGIHSRLRELLFGTDKPDFTRRVAFRGVVPLTKDLTGEFPDFAKWWGPDRHIVTYYINNSGEMYYVTSIPEESWTLESWSTRGDVEELRDAFASFHRLIRSLLARSEETYKWALYDRVPMESWGEGNVVLLGDACHPMTPYMAQGAAMAFEDAVVLARCLAESDGDAATAFRRYQETRIARTSWIQLESRKNIFLRDDESPDGVYGHDAWSAPLAELVG